MKMFIIVKTKMNTRLNLIMRNYSGPHQLILAEPSLEMLVYLVI